MIERIDLYEDFILNEKESGKREPSWNLWAKWYTLINMSVKELKDFMDSEEGKEAGLNKKEGKKFGIHTGRQSAGWLLKMIPIGQSWESALKNWTPEMWYWCSNQVRFNSRMRKGKGPLYDRKNKNKKTRRHTSLLIWGHDPEKGLRTMPKEPKNLDKKYE